MSGILFFIFASCHPLMLLRLSFCSLPEVLRNNIKRPAVNYYFFQIISNTFRFIKKQQQYITLEKNNSIENIRFLYFDNGFFFFFLKCF